MKPSNYQDILNAIDENGICRFSGPAHYFDESQFLGLKGYELKRALFKDILSLLNSFTASDRYVTRAMVEAADPRFEIKDGLATIYIKAAPVLCLPGDAKLLQIKVVRDFILKMKDAITKLHESEPDLVKHLGFTIMNRSEEVLTLLNEDEYQPENLPKAHKIKDDLIEEIKSNPVLSAWHKENVRMLSKMGPWSWMNLTDRDFFEDFDSPLFEKLRKNSKPKI